MPESIVSRFQNLFPGLDRVHGTYILDGEVRANGKKEGKGKTLQEPVTAKLWEAHLAGEQRLGIVPIRDDSTCMFGAVDIDAYQDFDLEIPRKKLAELEIPAIVLRSKSGGAHIYLFASEPIEAELMRARLIEIALVLGHGKAEIFPPQTSLAANDCGSWINMPYFGGIEGGSYALGEDGQFLTPEEFLNLAESRRRPLAWFELPIAVPKDLGPSIVRSQKPKDYESPPESGNRYNFLKSEIGRFTRVNPQAAESTIRAHIDDLLSKCNPRYEPRHENTQRERLCTLALKHKNKAAETDETKWRKHTELGNALRFLDYYGDDFRFNKTTNSWLTWNGGTWVKDDRGSAQKEMGCMSDLLLSVDLQRANSDTGKKAVLTFHKQSQSSKGIAAALHLASFQDQIAVLGSELNSDQYLLNCLNGTLDLRTDQLRPHNPSDLITHCCSVEYHRDATSTEWENFLQTATQGDQEIIDFLQRAAGYSLTGDTREEKLFFLHGLAGSGKSTFLEALGSVLGDYGATADFTSFLEKKYEGIPNDIARLDGPRFVRAAETKRTSKLDTGVIKKLTGRDKISARFLRAEFFEFFPRFKLWLCANDAPVIPADDDGMWRRVLRVPFDHVVAKADLELKDRLCDPKTVGPAILAWAVRGCLAWQKERGLIVPARLKTATTEYRDENDTLKDFLEERCVIGSNFAVPCIDLYNTFKYWSQDCRGDYRPMEFKEFGSALSKKKLLSKTKNLKGRSVRHYIGVAIRVNEPEFIGPRALPPAQQRSVPEQSLVF